MKDVVLLTGATGFLGHYLVDELRGRQLTVVTAGREDCELAMDLDRLDELAGLVQKVRPRYVVNAAAMPSISACQEQPTRALRINGKAPQVLATTGVRFLQVSTDLVFDGDDAPYDVLSRPRPRSVYGMSKLEGEKLTDGDWLVVRVPLLFGRSFDGRRGASDMLRLGLARREERMMLYSDEYRTPLHAADAARGLVDMMLEPGARGIRHLSGHERVSRWEFADRFCAATGTAVDAFGSGRVEDPRRPRDVSLAGEWRPSRGLDAALADC